MDSGELNEAKDSLAPGLQVSSFGQSKMLGTANTLIIDEKIADLAVSILKGLHETPDRKP